MVRAEITDDQALFVALGKSVMQQLRQNPYIFGLASTYQFASLGGFLFSYDEGVVSGVLTMESFAVRFPRIFIYSGFKGWFVSSLLLAAWFGSLINGPIADRYGRKGSTLMAVVVFTVESAVQAGATSVGMVFGGRSVAGLSVGMYMSEVSTPGIRGTLVVLQQLSITLGILVSYWLECGTAYMGGHRCAPDIPYTGGSASSPTFDPLRDVGPDGCAGQSEGAWRIPFALQIVPAIILGVGMFLFPESPRYLLMRQHDELALSSLAKLCRGDPGDSFLRNEFLAIKAEVRSEESYAHDKYPGKSGYKLYLTQYKSLVSTLPAFRRLSVGCCVMFFQQFIGCNLKVGILGISPF